MLNKAPYELWKGRRPNVSYFWTFNCKYYILNIKDNIGKFDVKSYEGIFIGYYNNSKTCQVYNKRAKTIEETMHATFDEANHSFKNTIRTGDDDEATRT